jgi:hypothetical protein
MVSYRTGGQWENNAHRQKMNSTRSVVKKMATNFVSAYLAALNPKHRPTVDFHDARRHF